MNQVLTATVAEKAPETVTSKERSDWPLLVRAACLTLVHASPQAVSGVSLSFRPADRSGEVGQLATLCRSLAAEYGFAYDLRETVSSDTTTCDLRLARRITAEA